MMESNLPPLTSLRVFEAAARHGSFTRAAEELGMTQAAVSYQIKVLEERMGAPLFLRKPRQVSLTETGERLAPQVSEAFELLRNAFSSARDSAESMLVINTLPTFAANWLAQRLGSFQLANPELAVRLETDNAVVDFNREEVDLAIRAGRGDWPGLRKHYLFPATFTPMLSPKLLARAGEIREPADLLKLPFIDPGDPWWREWFIAAGVTCPKVCGNPRSMLGAQAFEGVATIAGNGVGILSPIFFQNELEEGRLIQPFDLVCEDKEIAFWLVYPEARRNAPKIRAFRNWLFGEMGIDPATA